MEIKDFVLKEYSQEEIQQAISLVSSIKILYFLIFISIGVGALVIKEFFL